MDAKTIREMEAGRELDALVAKRVMRSHYWAETPRDFDGQYGGDVVLVPLGITWQLAEPFLPRRGKIGHINVPLFSTDIEAAWRVVDKLIEDGWQVCIAHPSAGPGPWGVDVYKWLESIEVLATADAATVPLDICRAALLAVTAK